MAIRMRCAAEATFPFLGEHLNRVNELKVDRLVLEDVSGHYCRRRGRRSR